MRVPKSGAFSLALAITAACLGAVHAGAVTPTQLPLVQALPAADGVVFRCDETRLDTVEREMSSYLAELGVDPAWLVQVREPGALRYTLATPANDTDTLHLVHRLEYGISPETVNLAKPGEPAMLRETVSRKEILLALMQHGRNTEFSGQACASQALKDNVALRQTIVAWTQKLAWGWPDGGSAQWNPQYWYKGTPLDLGNTTEAIRDAFLNQTNYSIGCYTASKMSIMQGVLDHYSRAAPDRMKLASVQSRLLADSDPLVGIEPGSMWFFESDSTPEDRARPGKLLELHQDVAPGNFVPGDWAYFLNPDPVSYQKTGYEGSNAIYLGNGRFDDYYADTPLNSYRYKEKLGEVYQWRNGVFSRSRDFAKLQKLTPEEFDKLGLTPEQGGLVLGYRAVPRLFGFEEYSQFANSK